MNMTRKAWLVPVLAAAAVCWGSTLAAQDEDEQEGNQAALAKAVLSARVSLERGLAASAAAQSQTAMAKAKGSLRAAEEEALRGNAGFRAVSVSPSLKDGRAVADVALAKGEELKTVSVPMA
jgi:hypothetical protein